MLNPGPGDLNPIMADFYARLRLVKLVRKVPLSFSRGSLKPALDKPQSDVHTLHTRHLHIWGAESARRQIWTGEHYAAPNLKQGKVYSKLDAIKLQLIVYTSSELVSSIQVENGNRK